MPAPVEPIGTFFASRHRPAVRPATDRPLPVALVSVEGAHTTGKRA